MNKEFTTFIECWDNVPQCYRSQARNEIVDSLGLNKSERIHYFYNRKKQKKFWTMSEIDKVKTIFAKYGIVWQVEIDYVCVK